MRRFTLKAARVQAGLGKDEAVERLGVSASSLWRWEAGKVCPPADVAKRICALYGVSFEDIDWDKKG